MTIGLGGMVLGRMEIEFGNDDGITWNCGKIEENIAKINQPSTITGQFQKRTIRLPKFRLKLNLIGLIRTIEVVLKHFEWLLSQYKLDKLMKLNRSEPNRFCHFALCTFNSIKIIFKIINYTIVGRKHSKDDQWQWPTLLNKY